MTQKERKRSTHIGRLLSILFALMALLGLTGAALAQAGPTGSLSGTVHDPTGASVSGAKITAVHTETRFSRTAKADAEGRWNLVVLPVGAYKVTIEATGFKKAVADVAIEAAVPRVLDFKMEVGEVSVEVNITDAAPLVTPTTATTFRQLNAEELTKVPTSTRSFTHLLSAEAGVSSDLPPVLTNGNGNISPSVNGTRTTSTSLSFNGIDATNITSNEGSLANNIAPAPETLSGGQTANQSVRRLDRAFGRRQLSTVTKSGGNQLTTARLITTCRTKSSTRTTSSSTRTALTVPARAGMKAASHWAARRSRKKLFFFGGYQRTQATRHLFRRRAASPSLPQALQLINGARTKENLFAAFSQLNPGITASIPNAAAIADVAVRLLNLKNPATGDFFIPAPRRAVWSSAVT